MIDQQLSAMIFALATDENTLMVFPGEADAVAYCEGIDVEAGTWLFWREDGAPLQAQFVTPNQHGRWTVCSGQYRLIPSASLPFLGEALHGAVAMERNPFFPSISAIHAHLAARNEDGSRGSSLQRE